MELRQRLGSTGLFAVRYEDFVGQPTLHLTQLCRYLGIEPGDDYLKACASILHQSPHQNRQMVDWLPQWKDAVQARINQYDFLQGYSFAE
jgi:hypothetical protein